MSVWARGASCLVALLLADATFGEAPLDAPSPAARPSALGPEPPARPEPRPEDPAPLDIEIRPEGQPDAFAAAPVLAAPPLVTPAPEAARDFLPAAPRQPPLIETEPPVPPLEGPPQVVRAELLLLGPAPLRVVVDGWEGGVPPIRPGAELRPIEQPAPQRPRARPRPPLDPIALLPPEPDAPPAYAPGDRPDILPVGPGYSPFAIAVAILPAARPQGIVERAEAARQVLIRGQVCGNPLIQGEVVAPVYGDGGCGIEEPVRIRSVDGVRLSEGSLMDCETAEALLDWVQDGARPAVGSRGGGLAALEVMGHYVCRPRNNQSGARLSEHGKGHAIDIGGIVMADGSRLSIAGDWPDPALREMHAAACGPFSTTLGPGSDGFHEDHLHFDTARGRGPYCR